MVVGYSTTSGGANDRAFLYFRGKPPLIDLNTKIDSSLGWTLSASYGINDAGKIVGIGFQGGIQRAFILDPTK
jgi:hypothetical protein